VKIIILNFQALTLEGQTQKKQLATVEMKISIWEVIKVSDWYLVSAAL